MDASHFVWFAAVAIVLLVLWKIITHAAPRRRQPRRSMDNTSSFSAHDPMLWTSMSQGGSQPDDQTPASAHDTSTWDASPLDATSSFDSGGSSFDCGGGDSGGGGGGGD